jgi:hypothetical protein
MSTEPIVWKRLPLPVPPSYEQRSAGCGGSKIEYVASPLEMAALMFDWDEEDD